MTNASLSILDVGGDVGIPQGAETIQRRNGNFQKEDPQKRELKPGW